jgi:hypothetical protein
MRKLIGFGLLTLLLTGCAPLQLDQDSAQDVLFSARDFSVDLSLDDEEQPISEKEWPIFGSSDECLQDADLRDLIEDEGKVLAHINLESRKDSGVYIEQNIIEFQNPEIAKEFIELVREGLDSDGCAYEIDDQKFLSNLNYTESSQSYDVWGLSQEVFDVSSDDSVVWVTESLFISSFGDYSSDSLTSVVRQNNYVLVLDGTIYRVTDADGSIKDFEKDFAVIVEQFVTGKRIDR